MASASLFNFRSSVWFWGFLILLIFQRVSLSPFDFSFTLSVWRRIHFAVTVSLWFHFISLPCPFIRFTVLFFFSCRLHLLACVVPHYCFWVRGLWFSGAIRRLHHLFVRLSYQFHLTSFLPLQVLFFSVLLLFAVAWRFSSFLKPVNIFFKSVDVTLEQILCMPNSSRVRPMRCTAMSTTPCSWSTNLDAEFNIFSSVFSSSQFFRCSSVHFPSRFIFPVFKFFSAHILSFQVLHFFNSFPFFSCSPGRGCLLVGGQ